MRGLLSIALAIVALLAGSAPSSAAVLQIQGDILVGATGVDVNGTLYNVQFKDGTCIGLFSGCDAVSDFTFTTDAAAAAAAQALLDQVFLGDFDTLAKFTEGCKSSDFPACFVFIPGSDAFEVNKFDVFGQVAQNFDFFNEADDKIGSFGQPIDFDFSSVDIATWAVFSPAAQVPAPGTLFLFGVSIVGLASFAAARLRPGRGRAQNE